MYGRYETDLSAFQKDLVSAVLQIPLLLLGFFVALGSHSFSDSLFHRRPSLLMRKRQEKVNAVKALNVLVEARDHSS